MNRTVANSHVRYFTLSLRPARGLVHPVDDALAATNLTRESLSHIDIRDGTGVLYYHLQGDSGTLAELLRDRSDVVLYDTIGKADDRFGLYLRVRLEEGGTLETCFFEQGLLIDPPVVFAGRGLRVTVIGTSVMVKRAMKRLPAGVSCSVERLGGSGDERLLLSALTDRQREVIETAFEMGYYEIPRRATHENIAAALDLSGSTIDEHLRKAEYRLMEQVLS
ncbi:MAG TPA: helix-turn-helix domain-containing protein [Halococcus sp.]|nr:helix-turn-helix domain-containing protein [Halococcus sp.]